MKKHGLFGMLLAICVGLGGVTVTTVADAKPKKGEEKKDEPKEGSLPTAPRMKPKGLQFRQSPKEVYKVYVKAIEKDYVKKYKAVSPGIQMQRLDYEKQQRKETFRLSYLDLKNRPSSLDGTKLTTEFTYGNGEGVMNIKRKGKKRYLFFIKKKLWNVVDIYKLGGKWGPDFNSAVKRLEKMLGVAGKRIEADPDNGQPYEMVQWTDGKMWLRGMNYGKKFAISYVDMSMLQKLTALRKKNAETKKDDLSPAVKGILREKQQADAKKGKKK